jgi:hypothetical protein
LPEKEGGERKPEKEGRGEEMRGKGKEGRKNKGEGFLSCRPLVSVARGDSGNTVLHHAQTQQARAPAVPRRARVHSARLQVVRERISLNKIPCWHIEISAQIALYICLN